MLKLPVKYHLYHRRIGENVRNLSRDEKYSHRMRIMRKRLNKRASKFSLEKETNLTHFGRSIGDMSKTELRSASIGSDSEDDGKDFSYDGLIAKSKEERAAAKRQKMEAEAELEDLDASFLGMLNQLERRDVDADKLTNGILTEDDDMAVLARSFQMENIRKAVAGDRMLTDAEKAEAVNSLVRKSDEERNAAALDSQFIADEDPHSDLNEEVIVGSDSDNEDTLESPTLNHSRTEGGVFTLIEQMVNEPKLISQKRSELIDQARETPSCELAEFFNTQLFDPLEGARRKLTLKETILIKIVTILFPRDHVRHSIVVPTIKLLEAATELGVCHLQLLLDLVVDSPRYSPRFLELAGSLYRDASCETQKKRVIELAALFCSKFTREALSGPLSYFFPELLHFDNGKDEPFVPLKLHHFKPVEVLSLEPAFHEDGTEWNGNNKELRDAKRAERQYKQEKKLTVKEMRREAHASEAFHAVQRQKEKDKVDALRKRTEARLQEAEQNCRLTKTDQGKQDNRKMKSNKRRRGK
jgi:hypothetical protein